MEEKRTTPLDPISEAQERLENLQIILSSEELQHRITTLMHRVRLLVWEPTIEVESVSMPSIEPNRLVIYLTQQSAHADTILDQPECEVTPIEIRASLTESIELWDCQVTIRCDLSAPIPQEYLDTLRLIGKIQTITDNHSRTYEVLMC